VSLIQHRGFRPLSIRLWIEYITKSLATWRDAIRKILGIGGDCHGVIRDPREGKHGGRQEDSRIQRVLPCFRMFGKKGPAFRLKG